jgi:hypothetical protein
MGSASTGLPIELLGQRGVIRTIVLAEANVGYCGTTLSGGVVPDNTGYVFPLARGPGRHGCEANLWGGSPGPPGAGMEKGDADDA